MAFRIVFLAVGLWENSALESRILSSGSMGSLDLSEIDQEMRNLILREKCMSKYSSNTY